MPGALVVAGELEASTDARGAVVLPLPDPGPWTVTATDIVTGDSTAATFTVTKPEKTNIANK